MELTDKWLNNAAGWQVAKQARQLWKSGAVAEADYQGALLKGVVIAGGKRLVAGFVINSATDLDNLCKCPTARRYGQVCAHSAAVALAVIHGKSEPKAAKEPATDPKPQITRRGEGVDVIFDPRLAEMWTRGRIQVKFERGEAEPAGIWDWLDAAQITKLPAHAVLNPNQAERLFAVLAGFDAKIGPGQVLTLSSTPAARLRVNLRRDGDQFELEPLPWKSDDQFRLGNWAFFPKIPALEPLRTPPKGSEAAYASLLDGETVRMSAGELLAGTDAWHECLEFRSEPGEGLVVRPGEPVFHARFEGSLNALSGVVTVRYGDAPGFRLGRDAEAGTFPFRASDGAFVTRNGGAEQAASRLLTENLGFTVPDSAGQFQLRGEADISRFFASGLAKLGETWEIELGERFRHVTRNLAVIRPQFQRHGGDNNWLSFSIDYRGADGIEIPRQEIQRLLNKGQTKLQLPGGRSAVVDLQACEEADEVIYDVQANQEAGQFRVRAHQAGYLAAAFGQEDLAARDPVDLAELGALGQVLRDYQRQGVEWMVQCLRGGAQACLLADEMGLGKTLQSLAAIQLLHAQPKTGADEPRAQSLVVCPTSLLTNWRLEAEKFVPELKIHVLHGPKRWSQTQPIDAADILVTSYALLIRDREKLAGRQFLAAILDEAGAIKNPDTKNAKACRSLDAAYRIALTGTPVENTVRELWSIFQFLVPGYLGSREEFRERYEAPVASGAAPGPVLDRLRKRIAPLTLRRLKQSVARDLPPKIEQTRFCELQPGQARIYEAILRESRKKIDDALSQKSEGQARMTMLTALLRLRQVCCDPRLLKLETPGSKPDAQSAKLDLFGELLAEATEGGHKILVFSQFTGMLALLRENLENADIAYAYLDGSSTDRAEQVANFQQRSGPPVFLISLKAGGYGLNLTAADTVIHYDPWWNPAVESQATDRAHRIGQTRPVSSYKLIVSGTVEERILALQRRKRAVIDAALDDGQPLMRGLSSEEIREVIG